VGQRAALNGALADWIRANSVARRDPAALTILATSYEALFSFTSNHRRAMAPNSACSFIHASDGGIPLDRAVEPQHFLPSDPRRCVKQIVAGLRRTVLFQIQGLASSRAPRKSSGRVPDYPDGTTGICPIKPSGLSPGWTDTFPDGASGAIWKTEASLRTKSRPHGQVAVKKHHGVNRN
jgi:hypothetical protein